MKARRADFPLLAANPGLHYLDSAATSQKPRIVLDAIRELFGSAKAMHGTDIAAGLASRHPGMYGSLDVNALGDLLRNMTPPIELVSVYVSDKSGSERTGKGIKREQLDVSTTGETAADEPGSNVRRLPLER